MKWVENHIEIDPPKRPKKITGTRFAAILGYNDWNTPFKTWCEITKTYEEPFEDNKYTIAGKTIEPRQAEYIKKEYGITSLVSPTDIYGKDYFKKTYGDFFKDVPVFGGMWDYLLMGKDGKPEAVFEMKTTKRVEDWKGNTPTYYALQAALYAFLLGVDNVYMVASFLEEDDYDHPELYLPSLDNTVVYCFRVSELFPDFKQRYFDTARKWWNDHVITGISPDYDETADKDILKALKTNNLAPDADIQALMSEAERLITEIGQVTAQIEEKEKRLKTLKDMIKEYALPLFREKDKTIELKGGSSIWCVTKSETKTVDKDALKKAGLLDQYSTVSTTYKLTTKEIEEAK